MDHFHAEIFTLQPPHYFPPLLAVHFVPLAPPGGYGWLAFFRLLGFHVNLPLLNSTGSPRSAKLHNLSIGVGPFSFSGQRRHHLHNRQIRSHASSRAETLQRVGGLSCRAMFGADSTAGALKALSSLQIHQLQAL